MSRRSRRHRAETATPETEEVAVRADGMANVLTGLGIDYEDKSTSSVWTRDRRLSAGELDNLHEGDGLLARMVDLPADEMVREGFDIEDLDIEDQSALKSEIESKQLLAHAADLHRWGDLHGGAVMVACVDDGVDPVEPLIPSRVRHLHGFFVLDRWCVDPVNLGDSPPEAYRVLEANGAPLENTVVHASRVWKHVGTKVSPRRQKDLDWWGMPTPQRVAKQLMNLETSWASGAAILQDLSIDVWSLVGIADALKAGNEELVTRRLRTLRMSKSVIKGVALDAGGTSRPGEAYTPQSRSVTGVAELIEVFIRACVIACPYDIPKSLLLKETVGGLGSGGNIGEHRGFYNTITARQRKWLTPGLNWMLEIMMSAPDGPTGGVVPDSWTIKHRPLWSMSEVEREAARKTRWETDAIAVSLGAANSESVYETRVVKKSTAELEVLPELEDFDEPEQVENPENIEPDEEPEVEPEEAPTEQDEDEDEDEDEEIESPEDEEA